MKFPGRIYKGATNTYLAIYNFFPDIVNKTPPSIESSSRRMAHVAYSEGGKRRGIDVFLLEKDSDVPEIDLANEILLKRVEDFDYRRAAVVIRGDIWGYADKTYDIKYDLVKSVKKIDAEEFLNLIRTDILLYCKRMAKNPQVKEEDRITYHDKIIPITSLRRINPERILTPGKQDFVPSCDLEANIDFAQGCISGWLPEPGASFDGQTFTNFFLSPWAECMYCYAQPKHKSFPKTIYNIEKERLKEELLGNCRLTVGNDETLGRKVSVLRFGKRTEAASKLTLDSFVLTLETCAEVGTRGVIPTKFLEYNAEIAKPLKKTNSVVLYSVGRFDELEKGACSYGCTNDWRIEQAIRYKESGVNSILYLLVLAHAPPEQKELNIIEKAKKHNIPVQLLAMRFSSKNLTKKVGGISWDDLKNSGRSLFGDHNDKYWGSYEQLYSGKITPKRIHQDWLNLIKDNSQQVRMCHHNSKTTWCGTCYLQEKGFIIETPEIVLERFGNTRSTKKVGGPRLNFSE